MRRHSGSAIPTSGGKQSADWVPGPGSGGGGALGVGGVGPGHTVRRPVARRQQSLSTDHELALQCSLVELERLLGYTREGGHVTAKRLGSRAGWLRSGSGSLGPGVVGAPSTPDAATAGVYPGRARLVCRRCFQELGIGQLPLSVPRRRARKAPAGLGGRLAVNREAGPQHATPQRQCDSHM
ncbi:coiled-coil domain-containing protein AGAP005037 isoform X15 [Ixodes scapularis]